MHFLSAHIGLLCFYVPWLSPLHPHSPLHKSFLNIFYALFRRRRFFRVLSLIDVAVLVGKKFCRRIKQAFFQALPHTRDHDCILYLIHVELLYTSKEALLVLSSVHYYSFRRFSTSFNIAMSNRHQKNCFVMFSLPKKNLPFSYGIIHRRWS